MWQLKYDYICGMEGIYDSQSLINIMKSKNLIEIIKL